MKLSEIEALWDVDCVIDSFNLGEESLKVPKLHSKYYRIYLHEKVQLEKLKLDLEGLLSFKWQFYSKKVDPDREKEVFKEVGEEGFLELRYLGKEIDTVIESDKQVKTLKLNVSHQQEKVEYLRAVIQMISNRNFSIKNAIDFKKFSNGLA